MRWRFKAGRSYGENKLKTSLVIALGVLLIIGFALLVVKDIRPPDLSWDTEHPGEAAFTNAHPQLTIIPTKFGSNVTWRIMKRPDGACMGIKMTAEKIIQTAFGALPELNMNTNWTVTDESLPKDEYDFICNLPEGATNAFQKAVSKKFEVTAGYRMVNTNVFFLTVRVPGSSNLMPYKAESTQSSKSRHRSFPGQTMQSFANRIGHGLNIPTLDHTGLVGDFVVLNFNGGGFRHGGKPPALEEYNQNLTARLGLELKPGTNPVEMFVIEKKK